jgi:hypothetical protein
MAQEEPTEFELAKHQSAQDTARHKLMAERANILTETRAGILNEGSKGLILINGGGAAALAAFLQAIWDKSNIEPMRWWVLFGMCWLLVGTAFSSLIFITRYIGSFHEKTMQPTSNPWWWLQIILTLASVICFLLGMGFAIAGGFMALCTR